MNIGFYGHSNCAYQSVDSLVDIVAAEFGAAIVNIGVRQGSEERILFELKKTKNLDLAIIFHSESQFIFIPGADRDISIKQINKSGYIFKDNFNHYHQLHHKKFVELFKNSEEFESAVTYLKNYFYHPDLQLNRFYGSIIQIDQYLLSRNISAIHVIIPNSIPDWFTFKSGVVDEDIMDLVTLHRLKPNEWFVNNMSKDGNTIIAERLIKLINKHKLLNTSNGITEGNNPLMPATVAQW